jgi:hypothetical protein
MANGKNIIIKGGDGKVAIGTSNGRVELLSDDNLISSLTELLAKRQAAGLALTKALAEAGYDVVATEETDVFDPLGPRRSQDKK